MFEAPAVEAITGSKPEVKICQTETLLLVSVMEAYLTEDEVNVSIEPQSIRIEITRDGVEDTIMEGKLLESVEPDHCRVRMKEDSVVIKLRKSETGRWKSILEDASITDDSRHVTPTPTSRIEPTTRREIQQMRAPIEPRDTPPKAVRKAKKNKKLAEVEEDAAVPLIQTSESKVMGTLELLKKSLFHAASFTSQQTLDEEDARCDIDIEGPLVKRPDPVASAE